jgi:hypothetical protein
MGDRVSGMDTLPIDGEMFFAWGEYRSDAIGKRYANKEANRMRKNGHKYRIIKRTTGIQVYCDSRVGAMGQ